MLLFFRLSSWRASPEQRWWRWETATLWTEQSLTSTITSFSDRNSAFGKSCTKYYRIIELTIKKTKKIGCVELDTQTYDFWLSFLGSVSKQQAIVPGQCYQLEDNTSSFKDFHGSRNNRFTSPEQAAKNRIQHPSNVLHFFNAQPDISEEIFNQVWKSSRVIPVNDWLIFYKPPSHIFTGVSF